MSLTPQSQDSDPLPYELLLRKTRAARDATADKAEATADDASTAAPNSSAASNVGTAVPCAVPAKASLTLLQNVAVHGQHAEEASAGLVLQTRELSQKVFEEDCVAQITKKTGWKLSLLVSDNLQELCGFIVTKVTKGSFSIAKLAVRAEFRGHGFGRLIMEEMIKGVRKQGSVYQVCLSSLPSAVKFYQRLGFRAYWDIKLAAGEGEDLVEGQVYMEKRLRKPPRK